MALYVTNKVRESNKILDDFNKELEDLEIELNRHDKTSAETRKLKDRIEELEKKLKE